MTPLQTVIAAIKMIPENPIDKDRLLSSLQSMVEAEKEFAEYVWMQGVATGYESGKNGSSSKPTLPEFLNQLYPEK